MGDVMGSQPPGVPGVPGVPRGPQVAILGLWWGAVPCSRGFARQLQW